MPQTVNPAPQASSETKKSGGRGRLLIILLVVLVASAGLVYFLSGRSSGAQGGSSGGVVGAVRNIFGSGGGNPGGQTAPAVVNDKNLKVMQIESFVVNLADQGHYLRATITLEYTDPNLEKELAERKYRVRDAVIATLRTKHVADLPASATDKLREELMGAINNVLQGKITGLYFEEFIIQ